MNKENISNKIITGMIVILPILFSIYFIVWIFRFIFSIMNLSTTDNSIISSLIFIAILILVFFITGVIAATSIGEKIISKMDKFLYKLPIANKFYSFFKQIIETIYFKKVRTYKKVVLVEYPQRANYAIGFLTSETPSIIDDVLGLNCYNIFIPTTPNPTSGMLILFPEDKIRNIDMSIEDAIKYVVSGGLAVNKYINGGKDEQ